MLEPISPEEAVIEYLDTRKQEVSASTLQHHKYRLQRFLEWCEKAGVENMNEITGRKLHRYKQWRVDAGIKNVTLKNQLWTLRVFLRFCEDLNGVPPGVSEKISMPDIGVGEDSRDELITLNRAEQVLDYCERYEYATLRHTLFYLLWHTGVRSGTARAIDTSDYDSRERYVNIVHRPKTGTPLKNKERGERQIHLKRELCEVLDDFLDMHHPMVEDENGRMPLFGTEYGRIQKTTLQRNIYTVTRPCHYTNQCPHDREITECEATSYNTASKCPSSVSPHAVRRGAITAHRNADVPKDVASERMNVSREVLDKHYDRRTPVEQREQRRRYLEDI